MLDSTDNKILLKAQSTYGYKNQVSVVAEECCELAKECNKYVRYPDHETASIHLRDKIVEEMADVRICLHHLEIMFNVTEEELEREVSGKLRRLERWLTAEDKTMYQTTVDRSVEDEFSEV